VIDIVEGFEDMVIYDDAKCAFKGELLLYLAKKHDLHTFVETGTYAGEMVKYVNARYNFDRIYSIELSERLAARADKLFQDASNVFIIHGASEESLKGIRQTEPFLYWLDAHYCGDDVTAMGEKITPVYEELEVILNETDHVIVIDDLDNFHTWGVYGRQLAEFIKSKKDVELSVVDTMLIIQPRKI